MASFYCGTKAIGGNICTSSDLVGGGGVREIAPVDFQFQVLPLECVKLGSESSDQKRSLDEQSWWEQGMRHRVSRIFLVIASEFHSLSVI